MSAAKKQRTGGAPAMGCAASVAKPGDGGGEGAAAAAGSSSAAAGSASDNKYGISYDKAAAYWDSVDATIDGVLGGFGHLTDADIRDSHKFLRSLPPFAAGGPARAGSLACDCGAGIGRVSKGLLLQYCEKVDIVEQCAKYTAASRRYVGTEHVREVFTVGLQDFDPPPATYDVIWVQWVIGHLNDADFVSFLRRCVRGLKPGGFLGMKENNCNEKHRAVVDEEDSSVTRSDSEYRRLFGASGLEVRSSRLQTGFPKGMFAIRMYWLQSTEQQVSPPPPPAVSEGGETAEAATA